MISTPTEPLRLDAVAVVSWLFLGCDQVLEDETIRDEGELAAECHRIGLPCRIEPLDMGVLSTGVVPPAVLERGAGIACDLGADFLKIPCLGSVESFERVVSAAGDVPVLVLGGRRADRVQDALDVAADAKRAGAGGVVFGRNVTQAERPGDVCAGSARSFMERRIAVRGDRPGPQHARLHERPRPCAPRR
jgi:DhnA family fructose-bisphosphate aldolase class Ia